jgi:hypothetical protein
LNEKLEAIFDTHDISRTGSLSFDELKTLAVSALRALVVVSGAGRLKSPLLEDVMPFLVREREEETLPL